MRKVKQFLQKGVQGTESNFEDFLSRAKGLNYLYRSTLSTILGLKGQDLIML